MPVTDNAETGRRERKKRATKAALEHAALKMFLERGFDNVTVADIASAVDVDPSTFFRHFGSKEAVLYEDSFRGPSLIETTLHERPRGETLRETLRAVFGVLIEATPIDFDRAAMQVELISQSDDLLAHHLLYNERIRERLAEGIADRFAIRRPSDPRPDILAAVVVTALDQIRADVVRKKRTPGKETLVNAFDRLIAPVLPYCDELDRQRSA